MPRGGSAAVGALVAWWALPSSALAQTTAGDEDAEAQTIEVRGVRTSGRRGVGDVRVTRDLLEASPRLQTSEMLSAAPGFFVDHEDGEGVGNDVYLRGFDLDHGSGIEMKVGTIPINVPNHIQGQGYADVSFVIPEVVRSIRVLEGPYDPRQGDAAIVGSASFDLGVVERGYEARATYGSFNQVRLVGIAAPRGEDPETFVAFALRRSDGFGQNRASDSGSMNAQYAFDAGEHDRVRLLATAYSGRSSLAGVVRQDDVDAGRIGFYDAYPTGTGFFAGGQEVRSSRVLFGATYDHAMRGTGQLEVAPFCTWTDFRARQNFTGALESSQIDPRLAGLGDLFETTNQETAAGLTSRFRAAPLLLGDVAKVTLEPGVYLRAGHTFQAKSLLVPSTLSVWDRRIDDELSTLDAGAYLDVDVLVAKRLRVAGGLRADALRMAIHDRIAGPAPASLDVSGIAAGPRVTAEYEVAPFFAPVVSYGEGFRSLDATGLVAGSSPYSKVHSVEAGARSDLFGGRVTATLAAFETWVANELVFEAAAGGLETERGSTRRGFSASIVARPWAWLLASTALTFTDAVFTTLAPGVSHYVPNVPPVVFRVDVSARGRIGKLGGEPVNGRVGVGYTYLSGRHLTDATLGPTTSALNAGVGARRGAVEVGVDAYNLLDLRYADDAEIYVSNWSLRPGQQLASVATHVVAAPPLTVLATAAVHF